MYYPGLMLFPVQSLAAVHVMTNYTTDRLKRCLINTKHLRLLKKLQCVSHQTIFGNIMNKNKH